MNGRQESNVTVTDDIHYQEFKNELHIHMHTHEYICICMCVYDGKIISHFPVIFQLDITVLEANHLQFAEKVTYQVM